MNDHPTPRGFVLFGGESDFDEQRAALRFDTKCAILVTNLTLETKTRIGCLHDVCSLGMRIETSLPLHEGHDVRINLPDFMVLAKVVHYAVGAQRYDVGLKLARPLRSEELDQCVQPNGWAKALVAGNRRPRIASFGCR